MANEVNLDKVSQKVFQMSSRRYRQLINERGFPPVKEGKIDFVDASAAVCKYYKDMALGQGSVTLTDERVRLTKINADRKQLQYEIECNKLVNLENIKIALSNKFVTFKTNMRLLPRKNAQELSSEIVNLLERLKSEEMSKDVLEKELMIISEDILSEQIDNALIELSQNGKRKNTARKRAKAIKRA